MNTRTLKTLAFALIGSGSMLMSSQAFAQAQNTEPSNTQSTSSTTSSTTSSAGSSTDGNESRQRRPEEKLFISEKTAPANANWQKVRFRRETRIPEDNSFTPYHDNTVCEGACPRHHHQHNVRSVVVINGMRF